MASEALSNLAQLSLRNALRHGDRPAYRQFDGSRWVDYTWAQFGAEMGRWQQALAREGLARGERVALCLRNRVEWALFDQAALGLGLVVVPLYFDDRPESMAFCLNDSGARLLLLENGGLWPALSGQVPGLKRVVCLEEPREEAVALHDWLPAYGAEPYCVPTQADDLATVVYTSGTTGRPKGVMLSHRNILTNVIESSKLVDVSHRDRFLSFLPLSHTLERTAGYYLPMYFGAQVVYARSISLLPEDLRLHRPTLLICVPRIFERIYARMQEAMPAGSLKRRLFERAVAVGWRRFRGETRWTDRFAWPLLKLLVARKIERRLGRRLRLIVSGGAAFAPDLARVFLGLGLPIVQGYGLTETSPVISCNRLEDNDPASVGHPLEGVEVRCAPDGELLARGPNIMLGYWNNPQATAAVIDADGWFHTGDLARIVSGRIYITGRVKEIIVMSNGEKVPPTDAEQAILMDATFEQVMLVGEGRPKLGLLAVSAQGDERELCRRANEQLREFPGYARINHIARVPGPWSVENGLLTPTLKLKRGEIARRFAGEIEAMYQREDLCR